MQGNIAVAVMGALVASTLGGGINRAFFKLKYDFLVLLWIMCFCVTFVVLIVYGGSFVSWVAISSGCSLFSVFGYFGYRNIVDLGGSEYENFWRIGSGIFLLLCSVVFVLTSKWWVDASFDIFLEKTYLALMLCMVVLSIGGLCVFF